MQRFWEGKRKKRNDGATPTQAVVTKEEEDMV